MKLCICAFAATTGILSTVALLVVGLINRAAPGYGLSYLKMLEAIYPGYHAGWGLKNLIIGLIYTLVDGAICGALFAFIYNRFAGCCSKCKCQEEKAEAPKVS